MRQITNQLHIYVHFAAKEDPRQSTNLYICTIDSIIKKRTRLSSTMKSMIWPPKIEGIRRQIRVDLDLTKLPEIIKGDFVHWIWDIWVFCAKVHCSVQVQGGQRTARQRKYDGLGGPGLA